MTCFAYSNISNTYYKIQKLAYGVVRSNVVSSAFVSSDVDADLSLEGRQRLDTEVSNGDEDTEH